MFNLILNKSQQNKTSLFLQGNNYCNLVELVMLTLNYLLNFNLLKILFKNNHHLELQWLKDFKVVKKHIKWHYNNNRFKTLNRL